MSNHMYAAYIMRNAGLAVQLVTKGLILSCSYPSHNRGLPQGSRYYIVTQSCLTF